MSKGMSKGNIRLVSEGRIEGVKPSLLRMYSRFGLLPDADLERVARASECQLVPAGNTIFRQDDEADAVYLLLDGAISLEHRKPEGQATMYRVFGPNETFGDLVLMGESSHRFTARTETPSILVRTPLALLREVLATHPDLAQAWVHAVSADLERRGHRFAAASRRGAKVPAFTDAA